MAALAIALLLSCSRPAEEGAANAGFAGDLDAATALDPAPAPLGSAELEPATAVLPIAVLQAGEFPLWFQFAEDGPVHIETIAAARYSAALIPWPHAPHVRFMLAQDGDLLMAVNRDGFVRLSPWRAGGQGVGLYRAAGGELWRNYTVAAFVRPEPGSPPVALLYHNDWFLRERLPPPSPRLWAFDAGSAAPSAASLPSLDAFAAEDGWNLDALRRSGGGHWYFRARRRADRQEIVTLRAESLEREGEPVYLDDFHDAARPEPLSAAPPLLREMLAAAFAAFGAGSASVVSPEFHGDRHFSADREGPQLRAFFSRELPAGAAYAALLLAADPSGHALSIKAGDHAELRSAREFSLPPLPEGFVYTGIGAVGDTVFATWEEQVDFSIGAAGFMAIKPAELAAD